MACFGFTEMENLFERASNPFGKVSVNEIMSKDGISIIQMPSFFQNRPLNLMPILQDRARMSHKVRLTIIQLDWSNQELRELIIKYESNSSESGDLADK